MEKREVLALLTKCGARMVKMKTKQGITRKPRTIIAYNERKGNIDLPNECIPFVPKKIH